MDQVINKFLFKSQPFTTRGKDDINNKIFNDLNLKFKIKFLTILR